MRYPAYESRELTGTVLLHDPEMMVKWKSAAAREDILARTVNGTNYSIIRDAALAAEIRGAYGQHLNEFEYDEESNAVRVVAVETDVEGHSSLEQAAYNFRPTGSDRDDGGNT